MQRKRERACEIQNPRKGGTKTVRARIHRNSCKAKTFMESLVIGINFQDTASRQAKSVMAKIIRSLSRPETGERLRFGKRVGLWIAYTYALEKKTVFRLYFAVLS